MCRAYLLHQTLKMKWGCGMEVEGETEAQVQMAFKGRYTEVEPDYWTL